MGFLSGVGKAGLGLAKGIGKVSGKLADGVGYGITEFGANVAKNAMRNPVKTATALGVAGAAGYVMADIDKHPNPGQVVGSAMLGTAALSAMPGAATAIGTVGAGMMAQTATSIGGLAMGLGSIAVQKPTEHIGLSNIGDLKFSKIGVGMILGGALYEGAGRAVDKFVKNRMGTHDGMMRTATPTIPQSSSGSSPSYANNGGATGDLVFSLYNNR